MKAIEAHNVRVEFRKSRFKKIQAIANLSLKVEEGDVFGLLGPNGAGKSTAMYCFLGLIRPNSGEVRVFEEPPRPGSGLFERIAYLPEEPHYHLYLTVEQAIRYYASLYRRPIHDSRIAEVIHKVGLDDFKDLRLAKCSKGMKQKAGIAVCLLKRPDLLFLDEPTRGLDPIIVKEFRDLLVEMNRQGTTVIVNSHMLSEIELVCNRVAIMNKGKVIIQDALSNLLKLDTRRYSVELDACDGIPEYIEITAQTERIVQGEIPEEKLEDFLLYVNRSALRLHQCSHKRLSLEQAFFNVLKEEA